MRMVIPLGRSVCQSLFTKSFRGGLRTYSTHVIPPSSEFSSVPARIGLFVARTLFLTSAALLARVGSHRSMDDDEESSMNNARMKMVEERYHEGTPVEEYMNGETLMVHSAREQTLFDLKVNGKGTSMRS